MELNRRQFLQGLAAGMAVAMAPPAVRATVIEEAVEETQLPWGFIVRGLKNPDLIMLPPGVGPGPGIEIQGVSKFSYFWPQRFDLEEVVKAAETGELNSWIELCPWSPYRPQMEALIPEDLKWKSQNWRLRR